MKKITQSEIINLLNKSGLHIYITNHNAINVGLVASECLTIEIEKLLLTKSKKNKHLVDIEV